MFIFCEFYSLTADESTVTWLLKRITLESEAGQECLKIWSRREEILPSMYAKNIKKVRETF